MKKLARLTVVTLLMVLVSTCAWSAVSVTWTDALGSHAAALNCIDNPDYTSSDPLNIELPYIWSTSINVTMNTVSPMQFSITGNFAGEYGEIWNQVRLAEHVTNNTAYDWTDFHMTTQDEESEFYNVFSIEPGWNWSSTGTDCDMVAMNSQYYKEPADILDYGVKLWAGYDGVTGDGSITFTQYPTYNTPEPMSCVVMLSGMLGLLGFARKRRI